MDIAFVLRSFPSLSQTFVLNQITGLLDRGHNVRILANRPGTSDAVHPDVRDYDLHERTKYIFPSRYQEGHHTRRLRSFKTCLQMLLRNPLRAWSLGKALARRDRLLPFCYRTDLPYLLQAFNEPQNYDVLHCHFGWNGLKALFLREMGLLKGPIVTTFHGTDVNVFPERHGHDVYDPLFESGDLFFAASRFIQEKLLEFGCPEDRLQIHRVGVNLEQFSPGREQGREGTIRFLSAARLIPLKGIDSAIRALAGLPDHVDFEYRIVGSGPEEENLRRLVRSLDLEESISFPGAKTRREISQVLSETDVYLAPSIVDEEGGCDTSLLSGIEAQAAGVPVVGTTVGGLPESIQDGETGFLVPQKDPNALAKSILDLIEHPEKRREMGERGRKFVRKHFDIQKLNDALEARFRELVSGGA